MIKFWFDIYRDSRASHRIRAKLIVDYAKQVNQDFDIVGPNTADKINFEKDIVIFSKDSDIISLKKLKKCGCTVGFDLCDNKFETEQVYKDYCESADFITANTPAMQKIIKDFTSKDSYHYADCVERSIKPPKTSFSSKPLKLLWYGGKSSIGYMPWQKTINDLQKNKINYQFKIVTNSSQKFYGKALKRWHTKTDVYFDLQNIDFVEWTYDVQEEAMDWCDIIVIPVDRVINKKGDRTFTKSHNRLVDGIASGCWVISSELPSYKPLADFCWLGNVVDGINFYKNNQSLVEEKISLGQQWIKNNASPEVVMQQLIEIYKDIKNE